MSRRPKYRKRRPARKDSENLPDTYSLFP